MGRGKLAAVLALVVLVAVSAAIAARWAGPGPAQQATAGEKLVTVMDSAGRQVTFAEPPERVVVLSSYWAEVLHCLGLGDRIVGIDVYTAKDQFLPEEVRGRTRVGSVFRGVNWEAVAALDPDLIIMGLWHGRFTPKEQAVFEKAEELGVPVLAFGIPVTSKTGTKMPYENVRVIRVLGKVFGVEERAEELAEYLEAHYNKVLEIARGIPEHERKRVLVVYGSSVAGKYATGPVTISYRGSAYAEAVELVGARNVAFDYNFTSQYPKLDMEKLIAYFGDRTDVLLVVDWDPERLEEALAKIRSDPRWHEIKAVREGRVVGVLVASWKLEAVSLYGPRFVTGLYAFGHAIYPERYPDWRPVYEEILRRFYGIGG